MIHRQMAASISSTSAQLDPTFPKSSVTLTMKVDGIFAYPQQWKTTDEANPNMFTYVVKFCNMEVIGGKIYARELTDKQKQQKQQEQAKKKGGKKQAKKQQNPAQLQKLKQQQEKQEAQERKRQQLWNKLTQQQKFHSTSQDKHKSALLKFENNTIQKQLKNNIFVVFEQHIIKDGGEWVYIYKVPTANQQELQKLKKSKPKNLNINDLNPVCMRAWLDLTSLRQSQTKQCSIRSKIHQIDATQQVSKPNLQKTYIKISLALSEPILTQPDAYGISTIIKNPPQPPPINPQKKAMIQLNDELRLAIQSLAMEYSNMFWKQLNSNQEQKAVQIFVNNKKNDHVKRKEQFLYDFNVSGKYKILKERLKKVIVHLCESKFKDKMEGSKSFTGITCSVRDQFYSQIYNYLVTSYTDVMHQLIDEKKQKLHQVFVLNEQNHQITTDKTLQAYRKQQKDQRIERIIKEYNILGNYQYGKNLLKQAITKNPQDLNLKFQYSMFCIKNGVNTVNQVLAWGFIDQYLQKNKNNSNALTQYVLLIIGTQDIKQLKKAWIILRQLITQQPTNINYLLYASILTQMLQNTDCSIKQVNLAYRQKLRNSSKIKQQGKHKTQPSSSQIPSLSSVATYNVQLKPQQKDSLWSQIIDAFSQLGLFNIIERIKPKLSSQQSLSLKKQNIKISYFQKDYQVCKEKALQLFNHNGKDYQLAQIIVKCCRNLLKDDNNSNSRQQLEKQMEKYLKICLQIIPADRKKQALLCLGQFYLNINKFGNSKACLVKYLDDNKSPGGLSWQMLGINELRCGNNTTAIECFRHSNLNDPYNKQIWVWIAQAYSKLNNFVMVNQCLNCYSSNIVSQNMKKRVKQLKQSVSSSKVDNFYDSSLKQKLLARLSTF